MIEERIREKTLDRLENETERLVFEIVESSPTRSGNATLMCQAWSFLRNFF